MNRDIEAKKEKLREELDLLKYEFKVDLPKRIAEARAYGDLKENAEYHAARERQSFVQARISQLTEQMSQLNDLNVNNIPDAGIAYGSVVTILDKETDDRMQFQFVSPNEVNPAEGKISLSSPIGMALQNKSVGEEVQVSIPAGKRTYYIEKLVTIHGSEFLC